MRYLVRVLLVAVMLLTFLPSSTMAMKKRIKILQTEPIVLSNTNRSVTINYSLSEPVSNPNPGIDIPAFIRVSPKSHKFIDLTELPGIVLVPRFGGFSLPVTYKLLDGVQLDKKTNIKMKLIVPRDIANVENIKRISRRKIRLEP